MQKYQESHELNQGKRQKCKRNGKKKISDKRKPEKQKQNSSINNRFCCCFGEIDGRKKEITCQSKV